jgi:hypothetical protein
MDTCLVHKNEGPHDALDASSNKELEALFAVVGEVALTIKWFRSGQSNQFLKSVIQLTLRRLLRSHHLTCSGCQSPLKSRQLQLHVVAVPMFR